MTANEGQVGQVARVGAQVLDPEGNTVAKVIMIIGGLFCITWKGHNLVLPGLGHVSSIDADGTVRITAEAVELMAIIEERSALPTAKAKELDQTKILDRTSVVDSEGVVVGYFRQTAESHDPSVLRVYLNEDGGKLVPTSKIERYDSVAGAIFLSINSTEVQGMDWFRVDTGTTIGDQSEQLLLDLSEVPGDTRIVDSKNRTIGYFYGTADRTVLPVHLHDGRGRIVPASQISAYDARTRTLWIRVSGAEVEAMQAFDD